MPGPAMARATPPFSTAPLNTLNSLACATSVKVASFMPKRLSGLSVPYCAIASA